MTKNSLVVIPVWWENIWFNDEKIVVLKVVWILKIYNDVANCECRFS